MQDRLLESHLTQPEGLHWHAEWDPKGFGLNHSINVLMNTGSAEPLCPYLY